MEQWKKERLSREHEEVYHAAARCQAAALSLTPRRLHGQKKACSIEGQKTGSLAAQSSEPLRGFRGVKLFGRHKSGRRIGLVRGQHGEENPCPDVGQSPDGHCMTFSFSSLALIICSGPAFLLSALPGQLMQHIAQRLDTTQPPMGLRVI